MEAIMSKHIVDSPRARNGSARLLQYIRIDRIGGARPQSKALQRRLNCSNPHTRTKRFLEIGRRKINEA